MVAVHRRIQKVFRVQSVQQNPISQMLPFHYPFLRTPAINANSFPSSLNMLCCSGCVSGDSGEGVWLMPRGNITVPLCIGQKVLKDSYQVTGSQLLSMFVYACKGMLLLFSPWLCPSICDTMGCSTPGFPVHHHLPELAQTHVH